MTIKNFGFLALPSILLTLSSCLNGDDDIEDYSEWLSQNTEYITKAEASGEYTKVVPKWDKASFVLMKWHNDRSLTSDARTPLDNSTIDVKYLLTNIKGDTIDSSYKLTTYGDSIFRCRPNEMVTGFWAACTSMHVGDTVTAVIPYTAGYGLSGSGSIPPYSTLIFQIKLDSIVAYETLPWRQ